MTWNIKSARHSYAIILIVCDIGGSVMLLRWVAGRKVIKANKWHKMKMVELIMIKVLHNKKYTILLLELWDEG